ncbi:heavy metal translocating P-type ATPase [Terribacillus saccharophilus]|uniref:heavy metal translocating P-type ATPase n=1 Tax=Terribacillus saccharophilus TaxID=361277 RepID=UPI002DC31E29|nr:heavy metal translocating P-type ATPase [Terribacillus saccharophilus]
MQEPKQKSCCQNSNNEVPSCCSNTEQTTVSLNSNTSMAASAPTATQVEGKASCCSTEPDEPDPSALCCSSNSGEEPTSNCYSTSTVKKKSSCCSSDPNESGTTDTCCFTVTSKEPVGSSCCSSSANESYSQDTSNSVGSETAVLFPPSNLVQYAVSGMDCGACAKTIEKSVSKMQGVQSVEVQFSTGKMKVASNDEDVLREIPHTVSKLGYGAEQIHSRKDKGEVFLVEGMDCGACAKTIENHLRTIPEVERVEVNFSTGKMNITHSSNQETIIREVKKAGYTTALASKRNRQDEEPAKKSIDFGTLSVVLSGLLLAAGYGISFLNAPSIISTFLFAAGMLISGYKPVKSAYYAVKSRSLDMNVLMSVAAIGAAIIGEWLEGALVVWLFSLGAVLQIKSVNRTRNSIKELMDLAPPEAWVKRGNDVMQVPVEDVTLADIIVVRPGDRIPLDGEIVKGESSVNQASITGESIPVDKIVSDSVFAGTVNEHGTLEIQVTKLVEDTKIAQIIELVEEAQGKQAPTQAFIDKFAGIYTPIVFVVALLIMAAPPLLNLGTWGEWFYRSLELLVIACPCALVISTPIAIVSAIGNAAKNGVLIKGGTFLEKAGKIKAIAFDKTGTITEGKPKVTDIEVFVGNKMSLLHIARTLEAYSNHPIAKSIVNYAEEEQISVLTGENFQSIAGKGVRATIDGINYYAGNRKLFEELNVTDIPGVIEQLQEQAKTIVILGNETEIVGVICVEDIIRTTTVKAIKQLEAVGMKEIVMLTGDNEKTAALMAEKSKVTRYFANLLPEDKVTSIKQLQQEGHQTAMVGDGINDAPALATADLGIAMGGAGTDTAIETADVVLMADNLEKLPFTMKLSKETLNIIKQNIWFSILIKVVALVLILPGWLTLWIAVLSDTGAALLVILNSLRLFRLK